MGNDIIEVHGLTKTYGSTVAVDDVGFCVRAGQVFGLVGANGAGKTTTIECLQGLRRPDSGRLRIAGLDPVADARSLGAIVGSQLQESALPDRLRVHEALSLFATDRAAPVAEVLDTWGLTEHRRTAFGALSGGQRQRLFVALALLNRPQVVFLDELTQGLDPAARRVVWELIAALRNGGTTVVLVTHFMDEAELLCDEVGVMAHGRLVGLGSPRELIDRWGSSTRVSFTASGCEPAMFAGLPGVDSVDVIGTSVEVSGSRSIVAHVGAALVGRGDVPDDLTVAHTTLEEAILARFDGEPVHQTQGGAA